MNRRGFLKATAGIAAGAALPTGALPVDTAEPTSALDGPGKIKLVFHEPTWTLKSPEGDVLTVEQAARRALPRGIEGFRRG